MIILINDFVESWKTGEKMYLTYKLLKYDKKKFSTERFKNCFVRNRLLKIKAHEKDKIAAVSKKKNYIAMTIVTVFFLTVAALIYYKTNLARLSGDSDTSAPWELVTKTVSTIYSVNAIVLFAISIITTACMVSASVNKKHNKSNRYVFPAKDAIFLSILLLITDLIFLQ